MTKRKPPELHKKNGRPSLWKDEYAAEITKLCLVMAPNDEQLAEWLGVSIATIYSWKNKQPKFLEAIKAGRGGADVKVVQSLYGLATGVYGGVPNLGACVWWTKNKLGWSDQQHVVVENRAVIDGEPLSSDAWEAKAAEQRPAAPKSGNGKSVH